MLPGGVPGFTHRTRSARRRLFSQPAVRVLRAPEPDLRTGEWIYRIEGRTADGFVVAVVFKFEASARY